MENKEISTEINILTELVMSIIITVVGAGLGVILIDIYAFPVVKSVVGGIVIMWILYLLPLHQYK